MANQEWTRRRFLGTAAICGSALAAGTAFADPRKVEQLLAAAARGAGSDPLTELLRTAPRARYWISTATTDDCSSCHQPGELAEGAKPSHNGTVIRCRLCAQNCLIEEGKRGRCRTRMNVNGELRTLSYGRPIAVHVDPIEKKPFFHFLPGSQAFSLATAGCPLHCKFCQNWEISQASPEDYRTRFVAPKEIVDGASGRSVPVIAFTYNEPTVFTEYLTDIARAAKPHGIRSVLVSCGFMNEAPLREMCDVLAAIKIDLKGYSEDFYHRVCSAELKPVLRSIQQVAASGVHLELVNLVVPTLNDSPRMMSELVKWVAGELGPDVPIHFTRFHPDYQLPNLPPTPVATLEHAREEAMKAGIHYAYVGNVPGNPGNHTYCPNCGKVVIERHGFFVLDNKLVEGRCPYCHQKIAGVWK